MIKSPISFQCPTPPSVNQYWRVLVLGAKRFRIHLSTKADRFHKAFPAYLPTGLDRITGHVWVHVGVWLPDRRERDIDNIPKGLFDAMTNSGVWHTDSQVRRCDLEVFGLRPPGGLVVTLAPPGSWPTYRPHD